MITSYYCCFAGVLGIISIILTSFQKKYYKESIKEKELYTILCKASITDIDLLIGVGLDKNVQEISVDVLKQVKEFLMMLLKNLAIL